MLGPSLFILYINDIVKNVQNCKIQLFADDTILYITGDSFNEIADIINSELNNIYQWLNNNYLHLNVNKTKVMFIRNKNRLINNLNNIIIYNKNPKTVNCFKYFG